MCINMVEEVQTSFCNWVTHVIVHGMVTIKNETIGRSNEIAETLFETTGCYRHTLLTHG
jgi:hypothetical protein